MLFDDSYERYWNRDDVCKNTTNLTGHSKYQIFEVQSCKTGTLKILRNHFMIVQKESCPFQLITFVKYVHKIAKFAGHFWNFVLLNLTAWVRYPPTLPNHIVQQNPTICLALGLDSSCLNLLLDLWCQESLVKIKTNFHLEMVYRPMSCYI